MKRTNPLRPLRRLSRGIRLVLGGGLAIGAGFGLVTGVSAAATNSSGTGSMANAPGPGLPGPVSKVGPGGPGGGGTITAISGTSLTLRTENGVETVDTSPSTMYTMEMNTVTFGALRVGDVVHVTGGPSSAADPAKSAASPQPGTGTVDATAITIMEPSFAGRVSSIGSGTYTLVGRDGELLLVTTTGSTRYFHGTTQGSASLVSVGSRVVAEGTRDSLTGLTAGLIAVAPEPPSPPATGGPVSGPAHVTSSSPSAPSIRS